MSSPNSQRRLSQPCTSTLLKLEWRKPCTLSRLCCQPSTFPSTGMVPCLHIAACMLYTNKLTCQSGILLRYLNEHGWICAGHPGAHIIPASQQILLNSACHMLTICIGTQVIQVMLLLKLSCCLAFLQRHHIPDLQHLFEPSCCQTCVVSC